MGRSLWSLPAPAKRRTRLVCSRSTCAARCGPRCATCAGSCATCLGLAPQHVQILFGGEVLPDHMTMKQLWLSRWFGKPAPLLLHYSVKEKRR
ncbi:polycomb group RING finger protein 1-like [Chelonia mydas]|uniref:polycomb group RING finger protein 1-like n=1 Tax=Chelonia mydas TaxID=8469 RepID=UPI001CA91167|nr:polycomb group RING finger protein 1-like [Chelonia mydas]